MEYKRQNIEYRISNIESKIRGSFFPKFNIQHSTFNIHSHASRGGFGMIEMVIGASVFSIALFSISNFFQLALRTSGTTKSAVQGDYLLEEGMEAIKIFRDLSYTTNIRNMSTTTTYYFSWNGTNWATTTTNTLIDGKFERKFTLADVNRDANSDIAVSGTYDPDIKLATVSVAWVEPATGTTTRSIQTYVTNIFNN